MEREERNAERQGDVREVERADAGGGQRGVEVAHEEVCVFPRGEDREVERNGEGQDFFGARRAERPADPQSHEVIQDERAEQHEHEPRLAPGVEEQAREQQHRVAVPAHRDVIKRQHDGQEEEQECGFGEKQRLFLQSGADKTLH